MQNRKRKSIKRWYSFRISKGVSHQDVKQSFLLIYRTNNASNVALTVSHPSPEVWLRFYLFLAGVFVWDQRTKEAALRSENVFFCGLLLFYFPYSLAICQNTRQQTQVDTLSSNFTRPLCLCRYLAQSSHWIEVISKFTDKIPREIQHTSHLKQREPWNVKG